MNARLLPLALLVSFALCSIVLRAQTFSEDISITEIEVPVQVLIDGRAVHGLTRDNFELRIDGEPRELTWFEELGPEAVESDETREARDARRTRGRSTPIDRARSYLLVFDFAFSGPFEIERAVDGARALVDEQSHPTDRISIALFSQPVGARIVVPFTRDRTGLGLGLDLIESLALEKPKKNVVKLEALDAWWQGAYNTEALPLPMRADLAGNTRTLLQPLADSEQPAGFGLPVLRPGASADEPLYRTARFSSIRGIGSSGLSAVREMGRSMASLVTMLRDVPEPKNVIWLSDGVSGALFTGTETRTPVLHRMKPMIDALGDTGWVLQAVDVGGIPAPPVSVFQEPRDPNSRLGAFESGPAVVAGENNASLFYLANETGGELYENYNRTFKATRKLLDRGRASYLLAFQLDESAKEAERFDIEVKLTPPIPGASVLHRPGFRTALAPKDRILTERRMDAAELALGNREIDELDVVVRPVVLPRSGEASVPVFVDVALGGIDIGAKGKKKARLDIHGYALDSSGDIVGGFGRQTVFRARGERRATVVEELKLPPGEYELRVLTWDLRGNRRHLATLPLSVQDGLSLAGPVVAAAETPTLIFEPKGSSSRPGLELLRTDRGLVHPDLTPALTQGRARRYLLLSEAGSSTETITIRVVDESGAAVRDALVTERIEDGPDGEVRHSGLIETGGLAPGVYRIEAALTSEQSGTTRSSATFTIVGEASPPAATGSDQSR